MSAGVDETDPDLKAAEYVLGTLDREEREAFTSRLRTDADTARAVAGWERRFAGLAGRIPGVAVPPEVWARIERNLGAPVAKMHPFKVIPGGGAKSDDPTIRRSRDRWRLGALVSGAIAAALAIFSISNVTRAPAPGDVYVAAVNRGGDKPALIVRVDLKTGQVLVRPVAASTPAGHSLELWYIGADKTPKSMGVVADRPTHLSLPEGTAADNATFAVSVEPPGGSKTGGPTGPVVYAGQLVQE